MEPVVLTFVLLLVVPVEPVLPVPVPLRAGAVEVDPEVGCAVLVDPEPGCDAVVADRVFVFVAVPACGAEDWVADAFPCGATTF